MCLYVGNYTCIPIFWFKFSTPVVTVTEELGFLRVCLLIQSSKKSGRWRMERRVTRATKKQVVYAGAQKESSIGNSEGTKAQLDSLLAIPFSSERAGPSKEIGRVACPNEEKGRVQREITTHWWEISLIGESLFLINKDRQRPLSLSQTFTLISNREIILAGVNSCEPSFDSSMPPERYHPRRKSERWKL